MSKKQIRAQDIDVVFSVSCTTCGLEEKASYFTCKSIDAARHLNCKGWRRLFEEVMCPDCVKKDRHKEAMNKTKTPKKRYGE